MKLRSQGPPDQEPEPEQELEQEPTIEAIPDEFTMAANAPIFKFGDDPQLFLFKLDAYIQSSNKESNEIYKNLALYTDNVAARWIMELPEDVRTTKDRLVTEFKAKFSVTDKAKSMSELRQRQQKPGEDAESFVEDMWRLCKQCDMPEATSVSFIVESLLPQMQFAVKIKNPATKKELIDAVRISPTTSLETTTEARLDKIQEQLQNLVMAINSPISAVDRGAPAPAKHFQQRRPFNRTGTQVTQPCGRCGGKFCSNFGTCKAIGQTCHKCGKKNHFAKMCRSRVFKQQ